MCNMTENLQVYDVQSLLTCFVRCCRKLADFFSVLKCLIHTYSAVISIFLVLIMNFPHSVSKRLILPWFTLTPKIIVKLLSADLQRIAVKTNFSSVSAVICPDCNIHPFFSNAFIRFLSCWFSSAIFRDSSGLRSPQPISRLPILAFLIQPYSVFTGI